VRLGIDYGTIATRAVLVWPDGRWTSLSFDGAPMLSSAVYVDTDRTILAGEPARRRAAADPARFIPHPKQHIREDRLQIGDQPVEVADLIAATLRQVGEQATRVAGQPADELTLTVPAGWGPQRRTTLRRAATRAGLPQPHLVDTPVAVAAHLAAAGTPLPPGAPILLCDLGAGRFDATILQRTGDGFEVLATIDSPDAAGLALDTALADHLATIAATLTAPPGAETPPATPDGRPAALAAAHAGITALAHTPALAIPAGTGPPIVIDQPTLHTLTQPVLAHATRTVERALAAADTRPDALAAVYCYGAGIPPPLALDALTNPAGPAPAVADNPEQAALLGAVGARGHPTAPPAPPTPPGKPGIRHYTAAVLPFAASLTLLHQATTTALPVPAPGTLDRNLFVLADWGEYGIAGLLAVQAATGTATLAAAHLARKLHRADPDTPPQTHRLLARFLPAAAVVGATLAGLYAIAAALWHDVPAGPFLRATLLAATPVAIAAAGLGLLAARHPRAPADTWLNWLTHPVLATAGVAAGIWLIQYGHTNTDPGTGPLRIPATYLGAALFGIAIALTAPTPLAYQVLAAPPLALTAAVLTLGHATTTLAALYTLATTGRLATRATQLALSGKPRPQSAIPA
jgi:hypothetical protein